MSKKRGSQGAAYSMNRRHFLRGATAAAVFPYIIPASARGAGGAVAPSNRITLGCIGMGRMGLGDLNDFLRRNEIQVQAVCDVDGKRREHARNVVEKHYAKNKESGAYTGCDAYNEFEELVARDDIDLVSIVTPDHWHIIPAIAAAKSGKDIFLQKPLSLTVEEGRALSDVVRERQRVFLVGSQQRSDRRFRFACELARNGRLGKVHTVKVGFGIDPPCGVEPEMPVPEWLDYDRWLGQAPWAAYTEKRVHPQKGYDRPGWLRIRAYGGGMMTGWGAHHLDIAQWGLGTESSGPVEIDGKGEYPKEGLWDVHGPFDIMYTYANGVRVHCANTNDQGVRFEGDAGYVAVRRGAIKAEPASLLKTSFGPDEPRLYRSDDHKGNLLACIKSRKETVAPVEVAHRSCTMCILGNIAMELSRKVQWDPEQERFVNDSEADQKLGRAMRRPWTLG